MRKLAGVLMMLVLFSCGASDAKLLTQPEPTKSPVELQRQYVVRATRSYDRFNATTSTSTSTTTTTTRPKTKTVTKGITQVVTTKSQEASPAPLSPDGMTYLGMFYMTCYELRGTTASGKPVGPGSIAVDPRIIPLGTLLYVDGYGSGDARDTGSAIKGYHIDVWKSECGRWSNRKVAVWRR